MERPRSAPQPDRVQTPSQAFPPPDGSGQQESTPPPVYNTGIGSLTFEQLYRKTSRTVGHMMREVHGMTNPEDIDDCMQAGYLKVWQRMEKDPDCFADKPKRYIVQAIVFCSKAQRFSHQRHYRKIVYDAGANTDSQRSASVLTTNQVDTWIDLEHAIGHIAREVEDKQVALLGLYCLITQATAKDVAATFGHGYSTLTAHKYQVRTALAAALNGYGPRPENGKAVKKLTELPHSEPFAGLVTTRLLEAIHGPRQQIVYQATEGKSTHASVPVEKHDTSPDTYSTGWGGAMTLEQIITDHQVLRAAFAKTTRLGLYDEDREDCVQQGVIRLWQKLRDDPNLLADKGPVWTGIYVAYSGNAKQFHRDNSRQQRLANLLVPHSFGKQSTRATWTREVEETIDTANFLNSMFELYNDNPQKLIALQAVIGATSSKKAAQQLGIHEKNFAASIGNQVRQDVQARLPDALTDTQPKSWTVSLARGEGVENIIELSQELMHNPRLLLALYVVTTSATKKDVARTFGYGLTSFGKDIRKIKQMIAAKYRREQIGQL